jgi:hypothetical protein
MALSAARLDSEQFQEVKVIHDRHHNFELVEPNYDFGTIVVRKDEKLIGAGYLRPILEAVMVLDLDAPLRDKTTALRMMINQAVVDSRSMSQSEFRAWAKNPEFARILQGHFNFEYLEGDSMRLRHGQR